MCLHAMHCIAYCYPELQSKAMGCAVQPVAKAFNLEPPKVCNVVAESLRANHVGISRCAPPPLHTLPDAFA